MVVGVSGSSRHNSATPPAAVETETLLFCCSFRALSVCRCLPACLPVCLLLTVMMYQRWIALIIILTSFLFVGVDYDVGGIMNGGCCR